MADPVVVTTDASARPIVGGQLLSWAYHYERDGLPIEVVETERVLEPGPATSVEAELRAAILALRVLRDSGYSGPVVINTDLDSLAKALGEPGAPFFPGLCQALAVRLREHVAPFESVSGVKVPRSKVVKAHNLARDAANVGLGRRCTHSSHRPTMCPYRTVHPSQPPEPTPSKPSGYRPPPALLDVCSTWELIRGSHGGATIGDLVGWDRLDQLSEGTQ